MEEKQPWVTCYLTDILLTHIRETVRNNTGIDYSALFRDAEGIETPADPESFLTDVNNWVPLSVLRELELQCERLSGNKGIAYHAAKAYFAPGKKQLPSLFEVIVQVLNDVRSAIAFANFWGSSQTNYLKLQSLERHGPPTELYMLARFDDSARPGIGAINLLRGFCEGFPRFYPFIEETRCIEEVSQLRLEDVVREFPEYAVTSKGEAITIFGRDSNEPVATARRVFLSTEAIDLAEEFRELSPDAVVVAPKRGRIEVISGKPTVEPDRPNSARAYQVVQAGTLSHGPLSYTLEEGRLYNAPYSRFRVVVQERSSAQPPASVDQLRHDISRLLFSHLQQIKQTHVRMVEFNVEKRRLMLENLRLQREIEREYSFGGILGKSKAMQEMFGLMRSIAETDVSVLIQGKTGTGKELIARAIHYNSQRKEKRFVAVNCGALSLTLLESELFGHEKGAFTGAMGRKKGFFEAADGGTLFLDEIGEISPGTQVKLLRVLQEGEFQRVGGTDAVKVDVRIIAATNKNLEELVKKGNFREDLYYRLNVFPVTVAPLCERADDIPLLAAHFIEKCGRETKKPVKEISPAAMALLMAYGWPGNVRELENAIQRMMVVSKGECLEVQDLPPEIRGTETGPRVEMKDLKEISRESAGLVEKRAIHDALSQTGGNVTHAAKVLGVSRATLQNKMKLYGLRQPKS